MKICAGFITIFVGIILCQILQTKAGHNDEVFAFHPITQDQYDAILGLTAGEPVISEARLIASGIAALKGIAAGLKFGLSASWLPSLFAGLGTSQRNATKDVLSLQDGYPLCVVKHQDEGDENASDEAAYDKRDVEENFEIPNRLSVVKCVVVVKQDGEDRTTTTTTKAPPTSANTPYPTYPHYTYPYTYPWLNGYYTYPYHYENPYQYEQVSYDLAPKYRQYSHNYETSHTHKSYPHDSDTRYKQKISTKYNKLHTKNRKPNPAPANYYDYTAPPRNKRRKTKRDQQSSPGNQDIGYQPASYPQLNYHAQYPKVSYSPSYNYPSPVYVGTTPRPPYFE